VADEPRLDRFVDLFNAGRFFAAHEELEAVWRERDGDPFLQGLIILAAAFVKLQRGSAAGAAKHLRAALRYLRAFLPEREGFDVAALVAAIDQRLALLAAGAEPAAIPPLSLRREPAGPPAPDPATDDEIAAVVRAVLADRAAGEAQAPSVVKEAALRLRGRAGQARIAAVVRRLAAETAPRQ
jgi:predicted metal-dependent hydrolase